MSEKPATEYRIEWTGNIQVHHPVRPSVHTVAKETAVSCS